MTWRGINLLGFSIQLRSARISINRCSTRKGSLLPPSLPARGEEEWPYVIPVRMLTKEITAQWDHFSVSHREKPLWKYVSFVVASPGTEWKAANSIPRELCSKYFQRKADCSLTKELRHAWKSGIGGRSGATRGMGLTLEELLGYCAMFQSNLPMV